MNEPDKIETIFSKIRETEHNTNFETIKRVMKAIARYLNNGETPKGFKNVKAKDNMNRALKSSDMFTWEDGLTLIKRTNSIQLKAALMTQLDGGFRPSEFIDLNYGDLEQKGKYIIVNLRGGKTGARPVTLYHSVPFLNSWRKAHPTKKKNDPLWVLEFSSRRAVKIQGINRYNYFALLKRIRELNLENGEKIIDKPIDFYSLRHSAVTLAKKQNLPTDLAADKFGHSVKYYVKTYGRLSSEDNINRFNKAYGESKIKEDETETTLECPVCGEINEPGVDICIRCSSPLTLTKALAIDKSKDDSINQLKEQMQQQQKALDKFKEEMFEMFKNKVKGK